MAKDKGSKQIRDTGTYTLDVDSVGRGRVAYHYINNLDAAVDVTVYATHQNDSDFTEAVQIGTVTVNASDAERDSLSDPYDRLQFELVAQSSPSSGAFKIKEHRE